MTDDLRARLEEDQRIIEDATGGPWEVLKERVVTEDMDMITPRLHSAPDAEFIAVPRTRWEQTNRALLKVLDELDLQSATADALMERGDSRRALQTHWCVGRVRKRLTEKLGADDE